MPEVLTPRIRRRPRVALAALAATAAVGLSACGGSSSSSASSSSANTGSTSTATATTAVTTTASIPAKTAASKATTRTSTAATHATATPPTHTTSATSTADPVATTRTTATPQAGYSYSASAQTVALKCLTAAGLNRARRSQSGFWEANNGVSGLTDTNQIVFVDGPYKSVSAANASVQSLVGIELSKRGGLFVVSATLVSRLDTQVNSVASCLQRSSASHYSGAYGF